MATTVSSPLQAQRKVVHAATGKPVGIDVGLKTYCTDSDGNATANPRYFRKAEQRVKRLHRRLSRKRSAEDFARKTANALVSSSDFLAYEDLQIRNMVRNRRLAKSISDASWGTFLQWVKYYGAVHGIPVIAIPPQFTTQDCSACGTRVKKSLSVRTHICPTCGVVLDRDVNAAKNILHAGLCILVLMAFAGTLGHRETSEHSENASGQPASTRRSPGEEGGQAGWMKEEPPCF